MSITRFLHSRAPELFTKFNRKRNIFVRNLSTRYTDTMSELSIENTAKRMIVAREQSIAIDMNELSHLSTADGYAVQSAMISLKEQNECFK
mgnify:FL=1